MGFLEDWNMRHFDRYCEQLAAGEHDHECEQRERSGICHCQKRRRLAEGRTEPPTLIYEAPTCNGCWKSASHDGDGWVCHRCGVDFDGYDEPGRWNDDYGPEPFGGEQFGERLIVLASKGDR